jgi:hypothetical protein
MSGSESIPGSVWVVTWHDERRGDRNAGIHGVFATETMARDEADAMNRKYPGVYAAVNYLVTPKGGGQ